MGCVKWFFSRPHNAADGHRYKIHVKPCLFLLALLSERPACSTGQTARGLCGCGFARWKGDIAVGTKWPLTTMSWTAVVLCKRPLMF